MWQPLREPLLIELLQQFYLETITNSFTTEMLPRVVYLRLVSNFTVHNSVVYTNFFTDFQVDCNMEESKGKKRVREMNRKHT